VTAELVLRAEAVMEEVTAHLGGLAETLAEPEAEDLRRLSEALRAPPS